MKNKLIYSNTNTVYENNIEKKTNEIYFIK